VVQVQGKVESHGGNQGAFVGLGLGFRLHRYTRKRRFVPTFLVYRKLDNDT
jgi:hypothetical protein